MGNFKERCLQVSKDRLWSKVQGWIERTISSAGKEVLVKSVAQGVSVFSMSCFKLPRGLCEHLNMLIRKFWWGSKEGKRKPHWVSWKTMTQPKGMGALRFKDFELFNLAMVARQAWRILQNPGTLSAHLLKSIYFPTIDFLSAELGNHPSQVWRAIIEGRDTLKQGLIKRIGNGADTNIWTDNWLPREEMMRPYGSISPNPPTYVSELITSMTASWNRQLVQQTFMPMDAIAILGMPICTRNIADFWAWFHEKNGTFTVKSAYKMLVATRKMREAWLEEVPCPSSSRAEEGAWKTLWKTEVPGKVRMFLWRLSKQSLPTNDVRTHRHMTDSPQCGLCGVRDSWRHSLLKCTSSRCTWALTEEEIVHKISGTTEPSAEQWLFTMTSKRARATHVS